MKLFAFIISLCIPLLLEGQTLSDTVKVGKTSKVGKRDKPTGIMNLWNLPDFLRPDVSMPGRLIATDKITYELKPRHDFDPEKMKLNLSLKSPAPSRLSEILDETPVRYLLYGAAILAGRMNNVLVGEDKMTTIRVESTVASRSGVPESAISGQGNVTVRR